MPAALLAFLKLIPLRDYLWGALIASLLGYHFYTVHEAKVTGEAHEVAALKASSDKLTKENDAKLASLTAQHVAELAAEKTQHAKDLDDAGAAQRDATQRLRDADTHRRASEELARAAAGSGDCRQLDEVSRGLEERLGSLEQVALGLKSAGDELRASLDEVSAERDSLTGK